MVLQKERYCEMLAYAFLVVIRRRMKADGQFIAVEPPKEMTDPTEAIKKRTEEVGGRHLPALRIRAKGSVKSTFHRY